MTRPTEWRAHDGGACPVHPNLRHVQVVVRLHDWPALVNEEAGHLTWQWQNGTPRQGDVIDWRFATPIEQGTAK